MCLILAYNNSPDRDSGSQEAFWQMRLSVYVKQQHAPAITNVSCAIRGCGLGDKLGNKGGIVASFQVRGCWVSQSAPPPHSLTYGSPHPVRSGICSHSPLI